MVGSKATDHHHLHHHNLMDDAGDHPRRSNDGDEDHPPISGVSCSICLELVSDHGTRSRAKLQCGHEFHLDCIGSAFNAKGAMQCPNCRKVEKGQWLYANGSIRSFPEFSVDDWIPDEDFYDLSYSEPFRVHWCPFGELAQVGSSFEEMESPSTTYHDIRGHHSIFAEHAATSPLAHSYVAYVGPIPPSSSRSSDSVTVDDPNFSHHWNSLSAHNEIFNPHTFPAVNIQYHSWAARHSPPFSMSSSHISAAEQTSVPPVSLRSSHGESDAMTRTRSFLHPFLFGHGSGPRPGSSFVSTVPRHPGSGAQALERIHHAHHHQQPGNSPGMPSIIHGIRRFDVSRGLPTVVPAAPQHDHSNGFYIIPPPSSSSQNPHDTEIPLPNRYLSRLQSGSSDRDSGWVFHHATGSSDSGSRSSSIWHRHL